MADHRLVARWTQGWTDWHDENDDQSASTGDGGAAEGDDDEDPLLAEAIAFLSGTRLLVLDRFDVLDLQGRGDLLAWLDILASDGEIDTALIFGTLKAAPSNLPETVAAHWIENGVLGQLREAA